MRVEADAEMIDVLRPPGSASWLHPKRYWPYRGDRKAIL
jgi:hypothetical protein